MGFRHNIRRLGAVLVLSFLAPLAALIYWQVFRATSLRAHPSNQHAAARRKRIIRGEILSAGGSRVAFNQTLGADERQLMRTLHFSRVKLLNLLTGAQQVP